MVSFFKSVGAVVLGVVIAQALVNKIEPLRKAIT